MRRNMFGEAYCTNLDELRTEMEAKNADTDDCYVDIMADEDRVGFFMAEVKDNGEGNTILWVELYDSKFRLIEDLMAAGFARKDIIEL